jgi:uncharacterized Zn finger protein (UPF0148 family)
MGQHAVVEQVVYRSTDCPECGVSVFMPSQMLERRQKDGESCYCPSGHSFSWHKTEAMRLREELEAKKKQLEAETKKREWAEQAQKRAQEAEEHAQRSAAAYKGKLKRVSNGVCPCCKRSFTNLRRHMATKHPEAAQ